MKAPYLIQVRKRRQVCKLQRAPRLACTGGNPAAAPLLLDLLADAWGCCAMHRPPSFDILGTLSFRMFKLKLELICRTPTWPPQQPGGCKLSRQLLLHFRVPCNLIQRK